MVKSITLLSTDSIRLREVRIKVLFKEHIARTIKEYFNKNMDYSDIRNGLVAAIAVNVEEPLFESQTKIKLGSTNMAPGGPTVNKFVGDFVKTEVDNYLHKHTDVADVMLQKIQESEKERKSDSRSERNWHVSEPRRQIFITGSYVTAAFI